MILSPVAPLQTNKHAHIYFLLRALFFNTSSYVVSCMTLEKDLGISLLGKAIDAIRDVITAKGGKIDVKMAPKAVSVREETELQAMMDRLALENEEIDGDAPEDD